jgi:hypothetical protein
MGEFTVRDQRGIAAILRLLKGVIHRPQGCNPAQRVGLKMNSNWKQRPIGLFAWKAKF